MHILTNAVVHTMDDACSTASALAWDDRGIIAVGDNAEVRAVAGDGAVEIDGGGRAVLPGFVDAHHHLSYSLLFEMGVDCHQDALGSIAQMIVALQRRAQTLPEGAWVVGIGYDEWLLEEQRPPTREYLDAVSRDRPVYVAQFSVHEACCNSVALALAGYDAKTPDPPEGLIVRDRSGQPTGQLVGTAMAPVEALARASMVETNLEAWPRALPEYEQRLFRAGITRVLDPFVPPDLQRLYRRALELDALRIPCIISPSAPGCQVSAPLDWLDHGVMGEGDDRLRIGPAKFVLDGAERCRLCLSPAQLLGVAGRALVKAVAERSMLPLRVLSRLPVKLGKDLHFHSGLTYLPLERSLELATQAVERGFSLMLHAVGEVSARQALDLIEAVRAKHPDAVPPRIEHGMLMTRDTMRRASDLGVVVTTQSDFVTVASDGKIPPIPCGLRMVGNRSMLDAGVEIASCSDYPASSMDPLNNLRRAVRRRSEKGNVIQAEEAITPAEFLRSYTRTAARACGCLDVVGSLEVGKRADVVVLSVDPMDPEVDLDDLYIDTTILGGEVVWTRERQ